VWGALGKTNSNSKPDHGWERSNLLPEKAKGKKKTGGIEGYKKSLLEGRGRRKGNLKKAEAVHHSLPKIRVTGKKI